MEDIFFVRVEFSVSIVIEINSVAAHTTNPSNSFARPVAGNRRVETTAILEHMVYQVVTDLAIFSRANAADLHILNVWFPHSLFVKGSVFRNLPLQTFVYDGLINFQVGWHTFFSNDEGLVGVKLRTVDANIGFSVAVPVSGHRIGTSVTQSC